MKYCRLILTISILLLFFPLVSGASSNTETLLWKKQGIEFEVPKGVQITENSKDNFTAEFDDFYIHLTLFTPPSSHNIDADFAILQELCAKMNVEIIDNGELDNDGLTGAWVEGASLSGSMMLMGLLTNEDAGIAILCKIIYYPNLGEFADNVLDSIRFKK